MVFLRISYRGFGGAFFFFLVIDEKAYFYVKNVESFITFLTAI